HLDEEREMGIDDHLNPIIQNELEKFLRSQFNIAPKIVKRWSGVMGFTKKELPLIGPWPDHENLYVLAGFSGHGMGLAFHGAKTLADSWDGESIPDFFSISS